MRKLVDEETTLKTVTEVIERNAEEKGLKEKEREFLRQCLVWQKEEEFVKELKVFVTCLEFNYFFLLGDPEKFLQSVVITWPDIVGGMFL